jgi:uncharacterized protein (TIGR02996 family)
VTTGDALLRTILDDPDDDTPRLAYADWLDEQGEAARADFIRLQVRLAKAEEYDRFWQETLHQRRHLIVGHASLPAPRPELPAGIAWAQWSFRRGFPWGVRTTSVETFLAHADHLFGLAPIQHLEVDGRAEGFDREVALLADSPALGRLRSLEIILARLGPDPVARLGASPHARNLRRLRFSFAGILREAVPALVASPLFGQLTELDLSSTDYGRPVGPAFAAAVWEAASPCRLEKLNLYRTRFGPTDAERLAAAPALRSLRSLDAGGQSYDTVLREVGLRALARAPHLAGLRALHLAKTEPGVGGVRELAESTTLTNLRSLDLSDSGLGPQAARLLAGAENLKDLTVLALNKTKVGDKGASALARSPHLTRLAVLDLSWADVGDEGASALLESPNLDDVLMLRLWAKPRKHLSPAVKEALQKRFGNRVSV